MLTNSKDASAFQSCKRLPKRKASQHEAHPDQSVLGLELLGGVEVVIDEPEARRLAAAELQRRRSQVSAWYAEGSPYQLL